MLEWNLATDRNYGPHTPGGCSTCLGAVTISGDQVTRNSAYYTVAHAAKFVRPGSVRIATNVAFKTPAGRKVLIVLNSGQTPQTFDSSFRNRVVTTLLAGGAAGTYIW